ncbi:MAG: hypothetical protein AAGG09_15310 [Pseudomonadota bacterium]
MATATPSIAERAATIGNGLDLGQPALIGVFGAPDRRRALVRSARGRITRVEVGDRLLGGRVVRIEPVRLVIERASGVTQLAMPDPV